MNQEEEIIERLKEDNLKDNIRNMNKKVKITQAEEDRKDKEDRTDIMNKIEKTETTDQHKIEEAITTRMTDTEKIVDKLRENIERNKILIEDPEEPEKVTLIII